MHLVIANNVKRLRDLRGWSQEHLAGASNQSNRTIQRIEAGQPCRAESLVAIPGAFDVELDQLRVDPDAEALKREADKWVRIAVREVTGTADLEPLFGAESASFECQVRDEGTREVAGQLHSYVSDVLMIGSDLDPSHRHGNATEMLGIVRELNAKEAAVYIGVGRVNVKAGDGGPPMKWRVVHMLVVPKEHELAFVVVPREQQFSL